MKNRDVRVAEVNLECRNEGDNKVTISGYALKFDRPSEDLGFIEYLDRRCLDGADMSNVVALVNHDDNLLLGRTGNNLTLSVDDVGLRFELVPNNTSYTRDLIENMSSGLINKCSFAFTVAKNGDEWRELNNGTWERKIKKIDRLFDVSVVTSPAYQDTDVMLSARSKRSFDEARQTPENQKELELMSMELDI